MGARHDGGVQELVGVRRVEARLLEALEAALAPGPGAADPASLARPLRVIVPSRSLREHVAGRIAHSRGRAALGVRIQTLGGVALEVLARAGLRHPEELLFPVQVRREARRETALAEGLEDRVEGYGAVVAAVDDLLDAGFEPAHAEALEEHLADQPLGADRTRRARSVVRVAARIGERLDAGALGHRSRLLVRAREALAREEGLLPHRGLWLHGFADATGVQADLLETLVREHGATLLLDAAPDPTSREGRRAGARHGAALRERFAPEGRGGPAPPAAELAPARITLLDAPTPTAEVRAVALRLRDRIDAGAVPERLAIVARDLAPWRVLLRSQLRRLGVPFSGVGERGAATAVHRRLGALRALLAPDDPPETEAWLCARDDLDASMRAHLRRECHRIGALRVEEVARSSLKSARVARSLLAGLERRPQRATLAEHARWLEGWVRGPLGWSAETAGDEALRSALAALPGEEEVDVHELLALLARALDRAGLTPLGGAGGGVQVLSVMEARGRSFDALCVLGLQRGAFPRTIAEDPLLPDPVRARLREVLPDLPVKRDGFDEERFLFAQLLSAAPDLTLSWSDTGFDGRPRPRSPLLESLERSGAELRRESAPPLHAPEAPRGGAAGWEEALRAGLHAPRAEFAAALGRALGPGAGAGAGAARMAVLEELDPRDARRSALGPYFGFVGAPAGEADPRARPVYVTRFEHLARCPWQAFLQRVLRLEPVADAAGDLPRADDPLRLGKVVHRVLERVAQRSAQDASALARDPLPMEWPDGATLDAWLIAAAEEELRTDAVSLAGYDRVLTRRARPYLERARECDWREGPPLVVATEVDASAQVTDVAGRPREIRFKADRVDREDGHLVFTDYKTGKPLADQLDPARRLEGLRKKVAAGRALQALLYARSGGAGARGRYLFLSEKAPEVARALEVEDAPPLAESFDAALRVLLEVWDRGSFLPRLREADRDEEPGSCRFCDVRDACIRGDSGARARLERWGEAQQPRGPAEDAADAVYRLGTQP